MILKILYIFDVILPQHIHIHKSQVFLEMHDSKITGGMLKAKKKYKKILKKNFRDLQCFYSVIPKYSQITFLDQQCY